MSVTIALLTDFGIQDSYVGVMKGVMADICPSARLIDITHHIAPQNLQQGAFTLLNSYRYFPQGTHFLVVVDPGVGSHRKAIAVKTEHYTFIAPDNGVLSYVLSELGAFKAVSLDNPEYQLSNVSHSFHGRDIFAPACAYLARGNTHLADFGERLDDLVSLPVPMLEKQGNTIQGEVVHIDHFGNIITSIGNLTWQDAQSLTLTTRLHIPNHTMQLNANSVEVSIGNTQFNQIYKSYHAVELGEAFVKLDSNGWLEIAVNHGNAAEQLNVVIGDGVMMIIKENE